MKPIVWAVLIPVLSAGSLQAASAREADPRRDVVVGAVEQVMPCVVNIATETIVYRNDPFDDIFRQFFGYQRQPRGYRSYSVGSGVVIDEEGYVMTNHHVIERANRIQVKFADGREYEAEPLSYYSPVADIALLKIVKKEEDETFQSIPFAEDDDLLLGETVLALGNPFGLGGSVSRGILSSKTRRPPTEEGPMGIEDWLQTDAAINPGNSGGPLVNLNAELIGLNVAVFRGQQAEGIGFAIPVKRIREAVSRIFSPETMHSLWFGVRVKTGSFPLVVSEVIDGSPADDAGIRPGDQVVMIEGKIPGSFVEFNRMLGVEEGDEVSIEITRDGKRMEQRVKPISNARYLQQRLGASLQELTPDLAEAFNVRRTTGLIIAGVDEDSVLKEADLSRGYLISGINGVKTFDLATAVLELARHEPGAEAILTVTAPRGRVAYQAQVKITLR